MQESLEEHLCNMQVNCERAREEENVPEWFLEKQEALIDEMWKVV